MADRIANKCPRCKKTLHEMDKCSQCNLCSACCIQTNLKKAALNATKNTKHQLCKNEWDTPRGGTPPTPKHTLSDFQGVTGLFNGGYLD